jgi:polyphosphate kinase 2 (PPK2 family)
MTDKVDREIYNASSRRLQIELIKTQESSRDDGERVVVLLEGRTLGPTI